MYIEMIEILFKLNINLIFLKGLRERKEKILYF